MGVLYDYFRAADDAAVVALMDRLDGGPVAVGGESVVDAIDFKGIDPDIALGQLIAFALEVPWDLDIVDSELVWPSEEEAMSGESPVVTSLPDSARDALAGIGAQRVGPLAERWARIEEFKHYSGMTVEDWSGLVQEVIGLAQRARDSGEHLYCWCCV